MDRLSKVINFIKLDDEKRIIISINKEYKEFLYNEKYRQSLKTNIENLLKDEFIKLEIGKNLCRITVKEGTAERNLEKIRAELVKGIGSVLRFMGF